MKVYTELKIWIDYHPDKMMYSLGYCGSEDVIKSIHFEDADTIPKFVWDMLHEDKRGM